MADLDSRVLAPERDTDQLIELFDTVFGFTVSPAMWEWKYRPPWAERHYCWVGEYEGKIIGYLGAVPLRGQIRGEAVPFFQLADVMVHPDYRMKFDYFSIGQRVVREMISEHHPRHLVYGFSDHRAFRWFERLGWVSVIEKPVTRIAQPDGSATNGTTSYSFRAWDWSDPQIDAAWAKLASAHPVSLIRDGDYLRWRYAGHPVYPYELLGVYRDGTACGWVVTGRGGKARDGTKRPAPVVDALLSSHDDAAVLQALANHREHSVKAWLPSHRATDALEAKPTSTHAYHFLENSALGSEALRADLFYTMGDVDWW